MLDLTKIDPSKIPDNKWEFEGFTPDGLGRTFIFWIDKQEGTYLRKKENLIEKELLEMNKFQLDESEGKRFGDGQSIARIPLNIFYSDFAARLREGDKDFTKWWLNHEDNRKYRNFRGKV